MLYRVYCTISFGEIKMFIALKSDDSRLSYSDKTIFKWRPTVILNFRNLVFWSCVLCFNVILLYPTKFRVYPIITRWDIAKRRYSIWRPNIVLNLHLDWLSTFLELLGYLTLDTWSFMFHHFDWKLPIQGQILGILGVNMGQISIFHFITPKRHILARFRVFWAIARQNPSRSLFSTLVREKK